ncbi:STAS domain-containing protein [Streptomyces sp. NPDC052012]|uniref:STAS domain-containing protein n=1 Tax=Streptomyces sp. NPDC052012 TaxID=3155051 RepID=UPI003450DBCB
MTFSLAGSTDSAARVPVRALGDILLVALRGEVRDGLAEQLRQDLARRAARGGVSGAVIGLSGVDVVGSFLGRVLSEIAAGARLPAARTVPAGIRPAVAIALVELGLALPGPATARDTERAVELLRRGTPAGPPAPGGRT